jgi:2-aminoadipate transaminase
LSQAILLRFAESGRLAAHKDRVRAAGAERLGALLDALAREMPEGTRWTQPEGGMNAWVQLPGGVDADEVLRRSLERGVAFLPGRYFAVSRTQPGAFRLSFAGIEPARIRDGVAVLGAVIREELEARRRQPSTSLAPAIV